MAVSELEEVGRYLGIQVPGGWKKVEGTLCLEVVWVCLPRS